MWTDDMNASQCREELNNIREYMYECDETDEDFYADLVSAMKQVRARLKELGQ